jgi:serine/threonine protein kinase
VYFAEKDIWAYAWQMCMGILYIHSKGVIHRDIKCMNILLTDKNQTLKLGDMSESRMLDHNNYMR